MNTTRPRPPRFDKQWDAAIGRLPSLTDRETLTEAIRLYQIEGTEPQLPPALAVAFEFLRPTIDRRARNRARRQAKAAAMRRDNPVPAEPVHQQEPAAVEPPVAEPATSTAAAPPLESLPVAPGEDDMEARFKFWSDFCSSRTSPLTEREITENRLSFELDFWGDEEKDEVPDHPDGTPMPYTEILQHYCRLLRQDTAILVQVADEVARLTKVLYTTSDLRNHIDAFIYQSTAFPIINLNRANCRRAFIRYMIRCANSYRGTLRSLP